MRDGGSAPDGANRTWLDRRVTAWAMYDVASSSYVAVVPLLFPLLYANVVLGGAAGADARFALLGALALVVAGVLTPLIGALADRGRLIAWLVGATLVCVAGAAVMPALRPGQVFLAGAAFVAAQSGYTIAMALYESFLPRLATTRTMARVSSFGWACGLLGGVATLVVVLLLVRGRPEGQGVALAVGTSAAVFALFAVPALLALARTSPSPPPRPGQGPALREAARALLDDVRHWRRHRNSLRFLVAFLLINDATVTVVLAVTLYMRQTFGTSLEDFVLLLLVYHLLAAPATLVWGRVADGIGLGRAIHANLVVWAVAILIMVYVRTDWAPWLITCTLATVVASTNALCRAMYARLVPPERSAEFFGFNAIVGRMSAAFGPTVYAALLAFTGSQATALLSLLVFIVAGALVLTTVDTSPSVDTSKLARDAQS